MGARPAPERPAWLVPGAEVVVKTTGGYGMRTEVTRTTIKNVSTQFFTLNDRDGMVNRFRVGTQDHHETGSGAWWSKVLPLDSSEARKWLDADRRAKLIAAAMEACEVCARGGITVRDYRIAAIKALQAIED